MAEFFVFDTSFAMDRQLFAGGSWINNTLRRCPQCDSLLDTTEPQELHFALISLGEMGFIEQLWNRNVSLPFIREDVVQLWRTNAIGGFSTAPVVIKGWLDDPSNALPDGIPNYFRIKSTSTIRLLEPTSIQGPCSQCGFVEYDFPRVGTQLPNGLRVDENTWDGSDIVGIQGYRFVLLSRHAVEVTLSFGGFETFRFVRDYNWARWENFNPKKWTLEEYTAYRSKFYVHRLSDL